MSENTEDKGKRPASELSHKATINRQKDIADEIRRVAEKDNITPEDDNYLEELRAEFDELDDHRKKIERSALVQRVNQSTGTVLHKGHTPKRDLDDDPFGEPDSIENPGVFANPWNLEEMRTWNRSKSEVGSELRSRAFSAIEKMKGTNDKRREGMTKIIEEFDSEDGRIARMALHTSHPDKT